MFPLESTVIGLRTSTFAFTPPSSVGKGLRRVPAPVLLLTLNTEPPAPGTYRKPLASAGWNTGSQSSIRLPAAFQSLANCQATFRAVCAPFHVYLVSPHCCDE